MEFEEWCEKNEEELYIMFAETGMDRELDFNAEDEIEKRYEKYLKENVEQQNHKTRKGWSYLAQC